MKITDKMIRKAQNAGEMPDSSNAREALAAALEDVPDLEPFTFPGYPDNEVYLHKCGTVTDVLPGPNDTRACIEAGECDCENTSPWMRIYVEKRG